MENYSFARMLRRCFKYTVWPVILYFFPKAAVSIYYKLLFGRFPDLRNPRSINEKLQVLKTGQYYNNPFVSDCIDKYKVKEVLAKHFKIKDLKYAALYAAFDSADELIARGFDELPEKFVIKCNHGGGYNFICSDKNSIDKAELKKILTKWMKEEYWKVYAEYQYRFIRKKVFIEEFLENIGDTYKFYCFSGTPRFLYVSNPDAEGNPDVYIDYFDSDFNHLDVSLRHHLHSTAEIKKPPQFERMLEIAGVLSAPFPFVRVDLYTVGDSEIYFSELTFLPTAGYMDLTPPEAALQWGDFLNI